MGCLLRLLKLPFDILLFPLKVIIGWGTAGSKGKPTYREQSRNNSKNYFRYRRQYDNKMNEAMYWEDRARSSSGSERSHAAREAQRLRREAEALLRKSDYYR